MLYMTTELTDFAGLRRLRSPVTEQQVRCSTHVHACSGSDYVFVISGLSTARAANKLQCQLQLQL